METNVSIGVQMIEIIVKVYYKYEPMNFWCLI